ncbi:MAG: hypothetical protein NUW37_13035 [Planctomycetes bacterium]|nr:hypothetical protein [Planctomycetota bacterium]
MCYQSASNISTFAGVIVLVAFFNMSSAFSQTSPANGDVMLWGDVCRGDGQPALVLDIPRQAPTLANVQTIVAGGDHCLVQKSDGGLWSWGRNEFGQIGNGTTSDQHIPVLIPNDKTVVQIVAGIYNSGILLADGSVLVWGKGYVASADGGISNSSVPTYAQGVNNAAYFDINDGSGVVAHWNGTVSVWGEIQKYLGVDVSDDLSVPRKVDGLSNIVQVAIGSKHLLALSETGEVYSMGSGEFGQLGVGSTESSTIPMLVEGVGDIEKIEAEGATSMILASDGTLFAFGANGFGQLGNGTETNRLNPTRVSEMTEIKTFTLGADHAFAIKHIGSVWGWGNNDRYQITNDANVSLYRSPVRIQSPRGVHQVAAGNGYSVAIVQGGQDREGPRRTRITGLSGERTSITLILEPATDNVTPANMIVFEIYAELESFREIENLTPKLLIRGGETTGTLNDLFPGMTYYIAVVGVDLAGNKERLGDYNVAQFRTRPINRPGGVIEWGNTRQYYFGSPGDPPPVTPRSLGILSDIRQVSCGKNHSLALRNDGVVFAWGKNEHLQLGTTSVTESSVPIIVDGVSRVAEVVAGNASSIVRTNIGKVYVWGRNPVWSTPSQRNGEMHYATPILVPIDEEVVQVAVGGDVFFALTSGGSVYSFSSFTPVSEGGSASPPHLIERLSNIVSIATEEDRFIAVESNGMVRTWLGVSHRENPSLENAPENLLNVFRAGAVKKVQTGSDFSLLLLNNGMVMSSGNNTRGQLGNPDDLSITTPRVIEGLSDIVDIDTGNGYSAAIDSEGRLYVFGANDIGQANGRRPESDAEKRLIPTRLACPIVRSVSCGDVYSLAVEGGGEDNDHPTGSSIEIVDRKEFALSFRWTRAIDTRTSQNDIQYILYVSDEYFETTAGVTPYGVFDDSVRETKIDNLLPGRTYHVAVVAVDRVGNRQPLDSSNRIPAQTIAVGQGGGIWGIGSNDFGELGVKQAHVTGSFVRAQTNVRATQVATGESHGLALTDDGRVLAFGRNDSGQLGIGNFERRFSPTVVPELRSIVQVACGKNSSAALTDDGILYTWGNNGWGQLGFTTNGSLPTPRVVDGLPTIRFIDSCENYVLAIDVDGNLWSFGYNESGAMGWMRSTDDLAPVKVVGIDRVRRVSAGPTHAIALCDDGYVWIWGKNDYGQLGIGTRQQMLVPRRIESIKDIKRIAAGRGFSMAVNLDNQLLIWGRYAAVVDGEFCDSESPIQVPGIANAMECEAGGTKAFVVNTDYTVWTRSIEPDVGSPGVSVGFDQLVGIDGVGSISSTETFTLFLRESGDFLPPRDGGLDVERSYSGLGCLAIRYNSAIDDTTPTSEIRYGVYVSEAEMVNLDNVEPIRVVRWNENPILIENLLKDRVYNVAVVAVDNLGNEQPLSETLQTTIRTLPAVTGSIWGSGPNDFGQIGDGTREARLIPVPAKETTHFLAVYTNGEHTHAINRDRTIWSWGRNDFGQLGDGTRTNRSVRVHTPGIDIAMQIRPGDTYTIVRDNNGLVSVFGTPVGVSFDGNSSASYFSRIVDELQGASWIELSGRRGAAVNEDGSVKVWGDLGWLRAPDVNPGFLSTPTKVEGLADVASIELDGTRGVVMKKDRTVWMIGAARELRPSGTPVENTHPTETEEQHEAQPPEEHPRTAPEREQDRPVDQGEEYFLAFDSCPSLLNFNSKNFSAEIELTLNELRFTMTRVEGFANATQIRAGLNHYLAKTVSGDVFAWDFADLHSAKKVESIVDAHQIVADDGYSLVLLRNGTVLGWGDLSRLSLGSASRNNIVESGPIKIESITNISQIAATGSGFFAMSK